MMNVQSQPMSDGEKLEKLLDRWERQPGVMLFGAGSHTCGTVASWIRAALQPKADT